MQTQDLIRYCEKEEELPSFEEITQWKRGINYKIIFQGQLKELREEIGSQWEKSLDSFLVGIHIIENEINVNKIITNEEIDNNKLFFEMCAKDYGILAKDLITELAYKLNVEIKPELPLLTLNANGSLGYKQQGKMKDWDYFFHGFHCCFSNVKTRQTIEVPLTFGLEFGELDPYFFSLYIKSTPKYKPLPVYIYCDFEDARKISNRMIELGLFERINSNMRNRTGVVVMDRDKQEIQVEDANVLWMKFAENKKAKPNLWDRLKAKLIGN